MISDLLVSLLLCSHSRPPSGPGQPSVSPRPSLLLLHRSIFLSPCLICSFCPSLRADTWPGSGDQYQSRPCRRTPSAATLPILAAPDTSVKLTRTQKAVKCVSKHSKKHPNNQGGGRFRPLTARFTAGMLQITDKMWKKERK